MTGTVVTVNGVSSALAIPELLVVRVRRQLLGDRRDVRRQVPGRAGAWVFPEQPGDRKISIEFDLLADSFAARRDAVRKLAEWADTPNGIVKLIIDDEPDRYYEAILSNAPDVDEWLLRGSGELDYAAGPYALGSVPETVAIVATGSPDSDTFAAAGALVGYPEIKLTPAGGTVTSFTLTMNGDALTWAGLINNGGSLTISSISTIVLAGASTDVELTGAYNAANLSMAAVAGTWPLIVPGLNSWTLIYTGTATSVTLATTWRKRYR